MNYSELYKYLSDNFKIDTPNSKQYEIWRILTFYSKKSKERLLADFFTAVPENILSDIFSVFDKRTKNIPFEYISGEAVFLSDRFFIDENCLIPRRDTEILYEKTAEVADKSDILELCCGCGILSISLAKNFPSIKNVKAVDVSEKALLFAEKNAAFHGVSDKISFICGDILKKDFQNTFSGEKFDIILANPPYIKTALIPSLSPEVRKEPKIALDGGADGLVFYRAIIENFPRFLAESGKMLLEIGYDQAESVVKICEKNNLCAEIFKDFSNNDRVISIRKNA